MVKTKKQKYLFRCKECGATFFFYIDETDKTKEQVSTNDKKLWCVACRRQGVLTRVEKVEVRQRRMQR